MSAEIACTHNILVTDFHLLKLLLVVLGFGSQTNVCGFSRQNICSVCLSFLSNFPEATIIQGVTSIPYFRVPGLKKFIKGNFFQHIFPFFYFAKNFDPKTKHMAFILRSRRFIRHPDQLNLNMSYFCVICVICNIMTFYVI